MSKVEKAVSFMERIAKDDKHGYDQIYRWGEKGDYDCSALVITAFEKAGFPVKKYGASYTGNMRNAFLKAGFIDIVKKVNVNTGAGLKRGDILLNTSHHTAVYCGNNKLVQASINEKGGISGGLPGDQTGYEINISKYKNYRKGWNTVLRYEEQEEEMVEKVDFLVNGKEVKMNRILKDNQNFIKAQDLENADLIDVDYNPSQKIAILDNKRPEKINIKVNGENTEFESILQNDTNYVKLRDLEKLGFKISYDNATKEISILKE